MQSVKYFAIFFANHYPGPSLSFTNTQKCHEWLFNCVAAYLLCRYEKSTLLALLAFIWLAYFCFAFLSCSHSDCPWSHLINKGWHVFCCWSAYLCFLALYLASFPAPPSFPSLPVRKSGRGPGIIYHVNDIRRGRDDLIEHRQIVDVPMHVVEINSTNSCFLVGACSGSFFEQ